MSKKIATLIDSSTFYYLVHEYIYRVKVGFEKEPGYQTTKLSRIGEDLGFKMGNLFSVENAGKLDSGHEYPNLGYIKFICSDIWKNLFGKTIDKLETDKKSTFTFIDFHFPFLDSISDSNELETRDYKNLFFTFLSALLKGIMKAFGFETEIYIEHTHREEAVTFILKIK